MAVQQLEERPTHLAEVFARAGFVSGARVCDEAAAARIRAAYDALEAVEGREKCQIGLLDRHLDQQFVWDLATSPAVLDVVEAAIGPDIILLATHFFCKYPEPRPGESVKDQAEQESSLDAQRSTLNAPPKFVAWHQDVTYWGLEPPLAVTAWYAVDDADAENGCMRVIPGTHLGGIREHGKSDRAGNLLSINQEVRVTEAEEASAVDAALRAGEISLHHGVLVHGSNPNLSSRRRCGLTIRYVPPYVKQVAANSQGATWAGILVRGRDDYHHFGEREKPAF
jgi:hypothetical protein